MSRQWKITQEELDRMPDQQQRMRHYELARHLLGLPNPPTDWGTCSAWLAKQMQHAAEYRVTQRASLVMFVEALHYVPDALEHAVPRGYLASEGLEQFRVERFLEWALEHKECVDELQ